MSAGVRGSIDARAAAAAVAWALDGEGFQSDYMRALLGRNWHARLCRTLEAFRRAKVITRDEQRAAERQS
jgi:hypothetical protein